MAAWWTKTVSILGRADALALAWGMLEGDNTEHQHLLHALDVRFWAAVGKMTHLDPALLSRGALLHYDTEDFLR